MPMRVPDKEPTVATTEREVPVPTRANKHATDESLLHEVVVHTVAPRTRVFETSSMPKLIPDTVNESPPVPGALKVDSAVNSGLSNVNTAESVPMLSATVTVASKPVP